MDDDVVNESVKTNSFPSSLEAKVRRLGKIEAFGLPLLP